MGDQIDILKAELKLLLQAAVLEAYPAVSKFCKTGPALSDIQIHISNSSAEFLAHAKRNCGVENFLGKLWVEIVANSPAMDRVRETQEKLTECGTQTWIGLGIYNPESGFSRFDEQLLRSFGISCK